MWLSFVGTFNSVDGIRAYLVTDIDEMSVDDAHLNDLPVKFSVCAKEGQDKLPTMYWLPKLHKRPYSKLDLLQIRALVLLSF